MTQSRRICCSLFLCMIVVPQTRALFNLNEGKELIFVSGTYSIGYDSNVFTRTASKASTTQSLAISMDYTRQAGLIGVTANLSAASGRFEALRSQDFSDPSFSLGFRKRYGRTTGALNLQSRRESQPDPDAGQRTQAWNHQGNLNLRYPVNDRYYFTNGFNASQKLYTDKATFSDLRTFSNSTAINYVYTSKLDLTGAYSFGLSDTSKNTHAFDQSLTFGASGGILPKLSGSVNVGFQRRNSETPGGRTEVFTGFKSGTTLKWLYSRRITFNGDLSSDFSTTSTDISVHRTSGGLHGTASLGSKYIGNAGVSYTLSNFLGSAGGGRVDELLQLDASIGLALTTHIRTSLAYVYMLNRSNSPGADFERHTLSFTVIATY